MVGNAVDVEETLLVTDWGNELDVLLILWAEVVAGLCGR